MDWFTLISGLLGGLALFLYGMDKMSDGLRAATGEGLKTLLARLTTNRFSGALTGAAVTAILNSSSVTTVLVVGFITAGVMSLSQSIGVIMGANIGSTFTAQIIAFNVTQYSLGMIAIGFAMTFAARSERLKHSGAMLMGLGLIFFGMGVMSEAMKPLRSYPPFLDLMVRMESPLLGILVGAAFTGLVQSSAATTGIAIVMASEGLMTLPAGISLALGANIGTCVTALLAAIGKPTEAQRAAAAHILFNVFGVALWVAFIPQLAELVRAVSPSYPNLAGPERIAAEVPRQIANAHTVFNIANTVFFLGFTGVFARIVEKLVKDKPKPAKAIVEPRFLDPGLLQHPGLALARVRMELGHLGELTIDMLRHLPEALIAHSPRALEELARSDDRVDVLHDRIVDYMRKLNEEPMTQRDNENFVLLMGAADDLERMADIVETDFIDVGNRVIALGLDSSEQERDVIGQLYDKVLLATDLAIKAVTERDERKAQDVLAMKPEINRIISAAWRGQVAEFPRADSNVIELLRLEDETIDNLKRVYSFAKRIARSVLPNELLQEAS